MGRKSCEGVVKTMKEHQKENSNILSSYMMQAMIWINKDHLEDN